MARSVQSQEEGRTDMALVVPAVIGAVTLLVTVRYLTALAGPYVLPAARLTRFATGIWASHALVFLTMGYVGGSFGRWRGGLAAAVVTLVFGLAAGLFYTQAHLLPMGGATLGGMAALALVAGLAGVGLGTLLPGTGFHATGVLLLAGAGMCVGAFLNTGVVSGKATRTISQITAGMMTGQKEVPVPGIPVLLCAADGKTRLYESKTDENGTYVFNGPRPGTYVLFAKDTEPDRGSGQWVRQQVTAHSHMSGQGIGVANIALPGFRETTVSPFLEAPAPSGSGAAPTPSTPSPSQGAGSTGGGTQGQMERLLKDATGGR
ncbi:hypothetical protein LLH03_08220 [bacterium]|nr:hypothetical protein [bacterium]